MIFACVLGAYACLKVAWDAAPIQAATMGNVNPCRTVLFCHQMGKMEGAMKREIDGNVVRWKLSRDGILKAGKRTGGTRRVGEALDAFKQRAREKLFGAAGAGSARAHALS